MHYTASPAALQPKTSIDDAMEEARMVMCGAIEGLLKKQGEQPAAQHGSWAGRHV
jgi:hypothetical protein